MRGRAITIHTKFIYIIIVNMWLKQTQIEECARVAHEKCSSCFSKNDEGDDVDNNKKTTEEKEAEFYLSLPTHKRPKCEGNVKLYHFFAELREQTMKINTNHGGGGGGGGGQSRHNNNNSHQHSVVGKVQESIRKCEIQIKDCETANSLTGVGPKMLKYFDTFFRLYPPLQNKEKELEKERLLLLVKEREKIRRKQERAKKNVGTMTMKNNNKKRGREENGAGGNKEDNEEQIELCRAFSQEQPSRSMLQQKQRKTNSSKKWHPKYKTAPFALLATLHKLMLEGKKQCTKDELINATDASGLSNMSIRPRVEAFSREQASFQGRDMSSQYSGWSCFNKYLKNAPTGHEAPMVFTWSNPMIIRLTDEGTIVAEKCHREAEIHGDCTCGLINTESTNDPSSVLKTKIVERRVQDKTTLAARRSAKQENHEVNVVSLLSDSDEDCFNRNASNERQLDANKKKLNVARNWHGTAAEENDWNSATELEIRLPTLKPGEKFQDVYDVVFLFDNREQYDKDFRPEHLVKYFENVNLRAEQCFIPIGDALWVAEDKKSKERFCLDYIIERKSVADLSCSITSGRYIRQKYRLDKCGLEKVMYLVEGNIERDYHLEERQKLAVKSALIETDIHDDIYMLRTESLEKTKKLYVDLTRSIQDLYNPRVGKDKSAQRTFFSNCLPTFNAFNENMKKFVASESTVQNTWGVMLAQVRGMGPDAAEAIVNLYPTPTSVYETFEQLDWDESRCVDLIAQIQPKERKIGRSAAQNLYEAFFR